MTQNSNTVKDIAAEPSTAAPLTLLEILTLLQIGGHLRMTSETLTASPSPLQQDPLAYLLNRLAIDTASPQAADATASAEAAPADETAPAAPDSVEAPPAAVPAVAAQAASQVTDTPSVATPPAPALAAPPSVAPSVPAAPLAPSVPAAAASAAAIPVPAQTAPAGPPDSDSESDEEGAILVDHDPRTRWYCVTRGTAIGVIPHWENVGPHVQGVSNASFARYPSRALAEEAFARAVLRGNVMLL
ncbi:hypothetical protein H0H92_015234 [Tricholoma furcatifolium]|nr:hypothetical protein H0H92_015234 [Tricholoma furcatifolium]